MVIHVNNLCTNKDTVSSLSSMAMSKYNPYPVRNIIKAKTIELKFDTKRKSREKKNLVLIELGLKWCSNDEIQLGLFNGPFLAFFFSFIE